MSPGPGRGRFRFRLGRRFRFRLGHRFRDRFRSCIRYRFRDRFRFRLGRRFHDRSRFRDRLADSLSVTHGKWAVAHMGLFAGLSVRTWCREGWFMPGAAHKPCQTLVTYTAEGFEGLSWFLRRGRGMNQPSQPQVLQLALQTLKDIKPLIEQIEARDKDLADQTRRAAQSIVLNMAEAIASGGGNRRTRMHTARGSANETRAALKVAALWEYVTDEDVAPVDAKLDRVLAMSYRWLNPKTKSE